MNQRQALQGWKYNTSLKVGRVANFKVLLRLRMISRLSGQGLAGDCKTFISVHIGKRFMEFPKIGCCGFPLPKIQYAECFPVVEVQQTFYEPPRIPTLQRWRALAPPHFEFTLKAWQLITHTAQSPTYRRLRTKLTRRELHQCGAFQSTSIVQRAWEITRACADALWARHLLFQCPASFTPTPQNIDQMRRFFTSIKRGELRLLWEPRGDWPHSLVSSLCKELDLAHVVDPFLSKSVSTDLIYFRLHGGKGFKQVFTTEDLLSVARLIPPGKPSYVMFNNRNMLEDAGKFRAIIPKHSIA
jgi:uncharacterized protein YecE (DUF72 family)